MSLIPLNTAETLSIAFSPGEDILFGNTSSQAIFSHGDYLMQRSSEPDALTGTVRNLTFSSYSTLENMGVNDFNPRCIHQFKTMNLGLLSQTLIATLILVLFTPKSHVQ